MEAFWAAQIIVLKAMSPGEGSVELVLDDPTGPEHLGVGEGCVGEGRVFIQSKILIRLSGRRKGLKGFYSA